MEGIAKELFKDWKEPEFESNFGEDAKCLNCHKELELGKSNLYQSCYHDKEAVFHMEIFCSKECYKSRDIPKHLGCTICGRNTKDAFELIQIYTKQTSYISCCSGICYEICCSRYVQLEKEVCATCREYTEDIKVCGKCKKRQYCSVECQRKDWRTHKQFCDK